MNGSDRKSIREISHEEGISETTLYNWRKEARLLGHPSANHDDSPEGWSSHDKFNAVLETAAGYAISHHLPHIELDGGSEIFGISRR